MFSIPEEKLKKYKFLVILYFSYTWPATRRYLATVSKRTLKMCHFSDVLDLWVFKRQKSNDEPNSDHHIYIPKVPFGLVCYYTLSTIVHLSLILYDISTLVLSDIPMFETYGKFLFCYGPRLMIQSELSGGSIMFVMPAAISILHIVYRYFLVLHKPTLKLPTIQFIMSDDDTIIELNKRVERGQYNHAKECDPLYESCYFELLPDLRLNLHMKPKAYARLNRTLEDRRKLFERIDQIFGKAIRYFSFAALTFGPLGLKTLLVDHDPYYVGCEKGFLNNIYFIRLASSITVTSYMFLDSFMAFFMPMSASMVLISDLVAYWNVIDQKLLNLTILMYKNRDLEEISRYSSFIENAYNNSLSYRYEIRGRICPINGMSSGFYKSIELEMIEIQAYTVDFFKQLEICDEYLSILMKYTLISFFAINSILTTYGIQLGVGLITVRAIQAFGVYVVYTQNSTINSLRQKTCSSYNILCSLMCLDQSKTKKTWKNILKYYTEKPRYGVTLAFNEMYSNLTFLKFMSYTITFVMVVDNLKQIKSQLS